MLFPGPRLFSGAGRLGCGPAGGGMKLFLGRRRQGGGCRLYGARAWFVLAEVAQRIVVVVVFFFFFFFCATCELEIRDGLGLLSFSLLAASRSFVSALSSSSASACRCVEFERGPQSSMEKEEGIAGEQGVVVGSKGAVLPVELLRLPPRPLVLEPYAHLAGLQAELPRQLLLLSGLQLRLRLERGLQRSDLLLAEPPRPVTLAALAAALSFLLSSTPLLALPHLSHSLCQMRRPSESFVERRGDKLVRGRALHLLGDGDDGRLS
ncbi:hypothetical protein C4D60_Mb01t19170 [Musa balbisiana]|uniref:Transmembrane protein n=1 Tax=Musa balbisiana TaxID=52838 RepID=A0A4V4H7H8_MUSBA|nr:hypothetical protein C4D60_Mb01t19170 [Musa balbisiana]